MHSSRNPSRSNGWVDVVARGFVGLWAGTVVGMVVVVVVCLVMDWIDPTPRFGWEGLAFMLLGIFGVCMALTVIWFLLDLPVPRLWPSRRRAGRARVLP